VLSLFSVFDYFMTLDGLNLLRLFH